MLQTTRRRTKYQGQWSLIGLLLTIAVLAILMAIIVPQYAERASKPGEPRTPTERAYGAGCSEYLAQINDSVTVYKMDHDDQPPRSLDDLKVDPAILHAPGCSFQMDPSTGQVSETSNGRLDPGNTPATAPGGIKIPSPAPNPGDL